MIIEITGAPGSGKSTIVKNVLTKFGSYKIHLITNKDAIKLVKARWANNKPFNSFKTALQWKIFVAFNILQYIFKNLRLFLFIFISQLGRSIKMKFHLLIWAQLLNKCWQYQLFEKYLQNNEAVFVDGGIVQFSLALLTSECEKPLSRSYKFYLKNVLKPSLLIIVKVPLNVCLKRVKERKRDLPERTKDLSPALITKFICNQFAAIILIEQIIEPLEWKTITVNNLDSINKVTSIVSKSINTLELLE